MAAGRPIKRTSSPSKRTPKVAGRGGSRVTVAKNADETAAETITASETTAEKPAAEKSAGESGTSTVVSGVERKRRAAAERVEQEEAERAVLLEGKPPRSTGATFRTAAIIGAAALVLGIVAAILAFHPGAEVNDNRAFVDSAETEQVLSNARSAACAPFQFDYKNLDGWIASTHDQFTGGALDQFETYLKVQRQVIEQTKSASECQVDSMGVESLDGDNASVIATLIVSTSRDGIVNESSVPHVRYSLVRMDGTWRVNEVGGF
ncbi:hypothetical protein [Gordonia hydrophobica]|uniref:Mce-associated membrane protein n=1 Tax=Gordonia hydrophobica TaxID=40516 RepID=A0ABZ2TVY7_9ACTN|nr:hypothetical protein [Gordonia hydrophobica]MBM7365914.1 Mce-associated membrane protein [Gordonia hydrophobica]